MRRYATILGILYTSLSLKAQVYSYNSQSGNETVTHRILIENDYLIETQFKSTNGAFILTRGGFFSNIDSDLVVDFEFNSNHKNDGLEKIRYSSKEQWVATPPAKQAFEGKWLMAGRVRDGIEQRRPINRSRKTMKLLQNGHFQWTAFDTENFAFYGCGGGTYVAQDGEYVEALEYFSRDDTKVGKSLNFKYELQKDDWFHQGFSSKGDPLHEIWTFRKND